VREIYMTNNMQFLACFWARYSCYKRKRVSF
jgi:hypothetical protein